MQPSLRLCLVESGAEGNRQGRAARGGAALRSAEWHWRQSGQVRSDDQREVRVANNDLPAPIALRSAAQRHAGGRLSWLEMAEAPGAPHLSDATCPSRQSGGMQ